MLKALKNAFVNIFKPPLTHSYPLEPMPLPEDYRGLIEYSADECIFCDKCENACPPKAIVFYQKEDGSKEYRYNAYACIYCTECVRACPKPNEALWQSSKKPAPAIKSDSVNREWGEWQKASDESRERYVKLKRGTLK